MITDELLLAAQRKMEERQPAAARELYLKVLAMDASHAVANRGLAAIAYEEGNLPVAADFMLRSANADAQAGASWVEAGILLQAAHRPVEAKAALQKARAWLPDNFDVIVQLGDLHRDGGELSAAVECYEQALVVQPGHARAQCNLADLFWRQGNLDAARLACQTALSLDPSLPEAHNTLGNIESAAGDYPSAALAFAAAVQLNPEFAAAHNNLGLAQFELGLLHDAQASFQKAVQLAPRFSQARTSLGDVLDKLGQPDEALKQLEAALKIDPEDAIAHWNAGNIAWKQGRHDAAAASFHAAMKIWPQEAAIHSNLLYAQLYDPRLQPADLVSSAREFAQQFEQAPAWQRRDFQNTKEEERRLRIGYVSADFRSHPVAHFLLPIFQAHDRTRYELFAYSNDHRYDEFSAALKSNVDHWVRCKELSDQAFYERISADQIDILIDLSGHTAGNRLPVFARRSAPIQITYLSYPGTTGLANMDYRLTDRLADPAGSEALYSEQLLYLPHSLCCYAPAQYMPAVQELPMAKNGFVTFGSFNNFNKVTDSCLAAWAQILLAVRDSRLLFVTVPDGAVRPRLLAKLEALGISKHRVEIVGKLPGSEFVAQISRADIALDPFPLTGGTTTMESLWLGLPTVILVGSRFFSRVGYSFLTTAGLTEFAAFDQPAYVSAAVGLATDKRRLAKWRSSLRGQLAASPLLNAKQFTLDLESLYRAAWRRWCGAKS